MASSSSGRVKRPRWACGVIKVQPPTPPVAAEEDERCSSSSTSSSSESSETSSSLRALTRVHSYPCKGCQGTIVSSCRRLYCGSCSQKSVSEQCDNPAPLDCLQVCEYCFSVVCYDVRNHPGHTHVCEGCLHAQFSDPDLLHLPPRSGNSASGSGG